MPPDEVTPSTTFTRFSPFSPAAVENLERAVQALQIHAGVTGLLLLLALGMALTRPRQWSLWPIPLILTTLLALQPGWTAQAVLNCDGENYEKLHGSTPWLLNALAVQVFFWQVWLQLTGRRSIAGRQSTQATEGEL